MIIDEQNMSAQPTAPPGPDHHRTWPHSMTWTVLIVVVSTTVGMLFGARAGAGMLAGSLAVLTVVRAVLPPPGPAAISIRPRHIDVGTLAVFAVGIGILAVLLPSD